MKKFLLGLVMLVLPVMVSAQTWNVDRIGIPQDTVRRVDTTLVERVRVDTVRLVDTTNTVRTTLTGKGVRVAIIDNGVDQSNPSLRPAGGYDALARVSASSAWNETNGPCNGHSTHIFGIVRQIAPDAEIFAVKVSQIASGQCVTFSSSIATALDWAVLNKIKVVVIPKSVSSSIALNNAIQRAIAAGVVIVVSAGNSGTTGLTYPASVSGVIAVGSTGQSGVVSSFSSRGSNLLLVAPGEGILSSVPVNTVAAMSGTSQAAPHVGGVVVLLLQAVPTATNSQIVTALCKGAVDIAPTGRDNDSGCGIVNAARALQALRTP